MLTYPIPVPDHIPMPIVGALIEAALVNAGLHITLKGTHKQYPGSVHWHFKSGQAAGTLEATFWPQRGRAWLSVQQGRKAAWIDVILPELQQALHERLMSTLIISPLADVPIPAQIAALPKADIHIHAETAARLEQILAKQHGQPPIDHRQWVAGLLVNTPPGMPRLLRLDDHRQFDRAMVDALDDDPANVIARIVHLLSEGAADGAVLIEVIFGAGTIQKPDFMALFREAERLVQQQFPMLRAEALIAVTKPTGEVWREVQFPACLAAAREGLAGINIIPDPYDAEMDWTAVVPWTERAVHAGLGLTAHVGEFATANIAAALQVPGLTRIGHAIYAAHDPWLLEQIARRAVTVECSLSCNVVLGGTSSYEAHPIRQFIAAGIPVTLNTDDPVRIATTIGREYAIAAALGFSIADLCGFTRNAVQASFAPTARRQAILADIDACLDCGD